MKQLSFGCLHLRCKYLCADTIIKLLLQSSSGSRGSCTFCTFFKGVNPLTKIYTKGTRSSMFKIWVLIGRNVDNYSWNLKPFLISIVQRTRLNLSDNVKSILPTSQTSLKLNERTYVFDNCRRLACSPVNIYTVHLCRRPSFWCIPSLCENR